MTHLFHDEFLINVRVQKGSAISLTDLMHRPSRDPQIFADNAKMLVQSMTPDPLSPFGLEEKLPIGVKGFNHPKGILCRVRDNQIPCPSIGFGMLFDRDNPLPITVSILVFCPSDSDEPFIDIRELQCRQLPNTKASLKSKEDAKIVESGVISQIVGNHLDFIFHEDFLLFVNDYAVKSLTGYIQIPEELGNTQVSVVMLFAVFEGSSDDGPQPCISLSGKPHFGYGNPDELFKVITGNTCKALILEIVVTINEEPLVIVAVTAVTG